MRSRPLSETIPRGVAPSAATGPSTGVTPAASETLGMDLPAVTSWPVIPHGQAVREDGSPFPLEDLPVRVALRTGEIVADVVTGVTHGQTGELRWLRVTAIPDARDEQGRPRRAYAIFTDLTEQRRTEAALQESTTLLGRLREANVLGVAASTEQGIYEANDAFLDIIGYDREDLAAGRISYKSITAPGWAGRDQEAFEQLRATGAFQPYDKEYVHRDGHRVPILAGAAVIDRNPLRWVTFIIDLTARQRAEDERAELLIRERAARAEADSARERLSFLMRAGALVAATRDRDEMLRQAARLVVPSLADYCVVFLPTGEGTLRAAALAHQAPARAAILAGLREHPIPVTGPLIAQTAYTTGTTQLASDVTAEMPTWASAAPEMIGIVALVRPHSAVATPLTAAGEHPVGVIVLGRSGDRPRFAGTDIDIVEELARRLGVGLANVDTFAREHTIAETLQRSVLPGILPAIPGLDLAVSYLPATEGADVGGDWYDAFPVSRGRVGLVTGDVAGHNIASAAVMGQVRSVLRAYAMHRPHPCRVLQRTNTALVRLLPEALVSVVYAVLNPATGLLGYANAGHPPPIVITGTGETEYLDDTVGVMLGACTDARFTTGYRRLPPGTGLLCYTDGLIEHRNRDISEGLAALAETLHRSAGRSAEQTCATVQAALLGTAERADDVCLLAAPLTG